LYRTEAERIDYSLMTWPIDSRKTFAVFGLMIGLMPPVALVLKGIGETTPGDRVDVFLAVLTAAGIATGIIGYVTGRFIPAAISYTSKFRFPNRVFLLSMIGLAWGMVSGAIGGLFLFIIGSILAGIVGGLVVAVVLPVLVALRSFVRRGDFIEVKHFLPIAFGITLTLCALILGF